MPDDVCEPLDRPVLIVGCGSIGRRHFRNLQALGCKQFVFYRTHHSTLPDADFAGHPTETDLEQALAHRPAVAVIANPTARHVEAALAAARSGCHLFIEKPLSHTLEHCEELAALVRQQRLTTMIGCQFRFHPLLVRLRDEIAAGRLGEVLAARAEWGEYLPDWHPWEDYRQSYSARTDLGGGVVLTLVHPLDYLYWMFGPAVRVQGVTRSIPSLETPSGEDWADISLEFAGGVLGQVHLDYIQKPPVHRLAVWGDRGRALWDYHAGTLAWESNSGESELERVPEGFERNAMFVAEMEHFLNCVRRRQPSDIALDDGIAVLEMALKAKQPVTEHCGG